MTEQDKSAHTPGPWHWVNPETDEPRQTGEWRSSLRTVQYFGEDKVDLIEGKSYTRFALPKFVLEADEIRDDAMEANARLIASAPELLEALKALLAHDECDAGCIPTDAHLDVQNDARAAIRKATGADQ